MKPEIKKLWVDALRSGEYEQGTDFLCNSNNKMCCLGVLYDVAVDGYWVFSDVENVWTTEKHTRGTLRGYLDDLGIDNAEQFHLTRMNDGGSDFSEIANWIEENL